MHQQHREGQGAAEGLLAPGKRLLAHVRCRARGSRRADRYVTGGLLSPARWGGTQGGCTTILHLLSLSTRGCTVSATPMALWQEAAAEGMRKLVALLLLTCFRFSGRLTYATCKEPVADPSFWCIRLLPHLLLLCSPHLTSNATIFPPLPLLGWFLGALRTRCVGTAVTSFAAAAAPAPPAPSTTNGPRARIWHLKQQDEIIMIIQQ